MADDEALRKAIAEAEAAEAELRRMKESLIPRDRINALRRLAVAEVAVMAIRVLREFLPRFDAATTPKAFAAVQRDYEAAVDAGLARVREQMLAQARSWTIAGLEDAAREIDEVLGEDHDP